MKKRHYLPPEAPVRDLPDPDALPTDGPIAVYYRQSDPSQIGNTSTLMQIEDLPAYLMHLGWPRERILLINEDQGVSGTKPIRERAGMSRLFDLILNHEIRAVACQDEDRLFRDLTQIQVNLFIQACYEADVRVVTPQMVYNFRNDVSRLFHARQFRFKSEQATELIYALTQGRVRAARQRLVDQGIWVGGNNPVGFVLDERKTLPDGSPNSHWRKFVPFAPFATVVKTYFELFWEHKRNIQATAAHIRQHGPYFPDFEDPEILRQVPPGHRLLKHSRWRKREGHYYPTTGTLPHLLSNPAYIGHFVHDRQVVKWHNHPAIVPDELFFAAFSTLSPTTLTGEPNPDYGSAQIQRTWPTSDPPGVARPLCEGLIVSYGQADWHRVGAPWDRRRQAYHYVFGSRAHKKGWRRKALYVDEAITRIFHARLEKTCALVPEERPSAGTVDALGTRTPSRLAGPPEATERDGDALAAIRAWQAGYRDSLARWPAMDRAEQQTLLRTFVDRIMATPSEYGVLEVLIQWKDESSTLVHLPCASVGPNQSRRQYWLPSDIRRVAALLERGATQLEIMAAFPERTWASIWTMAYEKLGKAPVVVPKPVRNKETYTDYRRRVAAGRGTERAVAGLRWRSSDIERLTSLVEARVTRVDLAAAFPYRTWDAIRYEITRLYGPGRRIPGFATIRRQETIAMYRARIGLSALPAAEPKPRSARAPTPSVRPFDVGKLIARPHQDRLVAM